MKRRCVLAIAAVAFAWVSRAADVRAQSDAAARWYDEVRGLIEDLAKQKLAEGLSKYLAEHQPAACYYFRGSLGRMQSGYWGGVPASLRDDGLELLGDWIFYVVNNADAKNLGESVTGFIGAARSRYGDHDLGADDLKPAARPCSLGWWDDLDGRVDEPIAISMVDASCRSAAPVDDQTRLACGVAQAAMAYLRDDAASVKHQISALTAWAVNEALEAGAGVLPNAVVDAIAPRLSDWIDDATSLRKLLDSVRGNQVLKAATATCAAAVDLLRRTEDLEGIDVACLALAMLNDDALLSGGLELRVAGVDRPLSAYGVKESVKELVAELAAEGSLALETAGCAGAPSAKIDVVLLDTSVLSLRAKADGAICANEQAVRDLADRIVKHLSRGYDLYYDALRMKDLLGFTTASLAQLPDVIAHLEKVEEVLTKSQKEWAVVTLDSSLSLALDVLRSALQFLSDNPPRSELAAKLLGHLQTREVETLTRWADRRDYHDIAMMVFEVFEEHAEQDASHVAEVRLLAKFVAYVLDSTDTVSADGLSTAAFRSAAMDYLSRIDKGFPVPASDEGGKWDASLIPSAALRYSWNPDYRSAATTDGFRRIVTVDFPRVNYAISRYAGFQISILDLVGPLTENALRADFASTHNDWSIFWDFLRPRFNAYLMVPQITRNLAIGASASWRPLEVLYPAATPMERVYCGPFCEEWNVGTAEVDLAVIVAF